MTLEELGDGARAARETAYAQARSVRAEFGGFTLLSELVVYADVPEELAEELSDRLVFLAWGKSLRTLRPVLVSHHYC